MESNASGGAADWLGAWERHLATRDLRPRTRGDYEAALKAYTRWLGQPLTPAQVNAANVVRFKEALMARRLSAPTVNRHLAALAAFAAWDEAQAGGALLPARSVRYLPRGEGAPRAIPPEQQNTLRTAVERRAGSGEGPMLRALLALLLDGGLRVSEVTGLTPADFQPADNGRLLVCVPAAVAKGARERVVPLPPAAETDIRDWVATRGAHEPLWPGQRGPLTPRGVRLRLARLAQEAGIPPTTPHQLRHSLGKRLADGGVPLDRIARILGHRSLNVTARYTRASIDDLLSIVDAHASEAPSKNGGRPDPREQGAHDGD
jgi:integrase/recombinase XerC